MFKDEYLFSTGAVREAEKRLLDAGDMERMIDSGDAEQSFKIFNDLSYVDELLEIEDPAEYRKALTHDMGQVKDFLITISPNEEIKKFIFSFEDFYNLRLIFKSIAGGKELGEGLSALGFIQGEDLLSYTRDGNIAVAIPYEYVRAIKRLKEVISERSTGGEIDTLIDREYFRLLIGLTKKIGNSILKELVRHYIDTVNIKIIIRVGMIGQDQALGGINIIKGGNLDRSLLGEWSKLDEADIINNLILKLDDSELAGDLKELLEDIELSQLDKILDNFLIRIFRKAKYVEAGPAILWAYWWGKKNAIKNISLIMTGKLNNIETTEIKTQIRDLY